MLHQEDCNIARRKEEINIFLLQKSHRNKLSGRQKHRTELEFAGSYGNELCECEQQPFPFHNIG
jgi:hypothetical protein